MSLGITEIILILAVVLVLFGGKRIPELAKALGRAQHEYKKAKEALENEAKSFKESVETVVESEDKTKKEAKIEETNNTENKA